MKSSKLRSFTAVLSKILEVFAFIGAGICAFITIMNFVFLKSSYETIASGDASLNFQGVKPEHITEANYLPVSTTWLVFMVASLFLVGMLFRSVNIIFKKTNTDSPFNETNVSMVKRIGYLALAIPVVKTLAIIIIGIYTGDATLSLELSEYVFALIIICLSQYFAYGASLEKDVNGLL
jgi:hypothetical protein